jgi:hypothetical protein
VRHFLGCVGHVDSLTCAAARVRVRTRRRVTRSAMIRAASS